MRDDDGGRVSDGGAMTRQTMRPTSPPPSAPPEHLAGLTGMDLVRRTLEEARGAARSQGKDVGRGRTSPTPDGSPAGGARGRGRDPMRGIRRRSARRRGIWPGPAVGRGESPRARCSAQWQTVVGEQIAAHATPTGLRDGVLSVSAESTAWATQLRMVQAQLLAKIAAAVGDGVVTSLKIVGPVASVLAQGQVSHRRPRPARHIRMTVFRPLAESRRERRKPILKRLDAPWIEKFHRRRE